jgi:hypothetical protein
MEPGPVWNPFAMPMGWASPAIMAPKEPRAACPADLYTGANSAHSCRRSLAGETMTVSASRTQSQSYTAQATGQALP